MKKTVLMLVTSLIGVSTFAGVGVGIKAGANFANQSLTDPLSTFDPKSIVAFHGGAYFNVFFGDKIGIQPEFLWSKKGTKFDLNSIESDINLSYIDIPIMVKWQIIKFLNIHAGPQFNVLLNAEKTEGSVPEDIKNQIKNNEFAFAFGAEVNLPLNLSVTARYVLGITQISDIEGLPENNKLLQLSLAYRLLGK